MQFQFDVASSTSSPPPAPQPTTDSIPELLRLMFEMQRDHLAQILEVQKEQLNQARAAAQDSVARWKNLLSRWQAEYPQLAEQCKQAYPVLERTYVTMLVNLVDELGHGDDSLDSEFAVQEFLDKYGMRVGQMSHLLSVIGPLAEAANQAEAK